MMKIGERLNFLIYCNRARVNETLRISGGLLREPTLPLLPLLPQSLHHN